MKFSIKDFFSKCEQICIFLRIWLHLLKNFLIETSFFVQWFYQAFPKALFWDHYFATFLVMILSYFFKSTSLQITLMIVLCTHLTQILIILWPHWIRALLFYQSGWFYKNFMVLNPDEHSFMLSGVKDELQTDFVSNNIIIKKYRRRKSTGNQYW